jgi:hypothetical protein
MGWTVYLYPFMVSNIDKKLLNKRKVESSNIPFTSAPAMDGIRDIGARSGFFRSSKQPQAQIPR